MFEDFKLFLGLSLMLLFLSFFIGNLVGLVFDNKVLLGSFVLEVG
jgi:hypothetical protein